MFYYVKGELVALAPAFAAIDCAGVAYKLNISGTTHAALAKTGVGGKAKLFTYLAVREDAMELYGFAGESELDCYTMLISVSGVGPKAAIAVLSALSPDALAAAIASGDWHSISKANGVGPKTAQRIVLELRDKITRQIENGDAVFSDDASGGAPASVTSEAINALCVLGYTRNDATKLVTKAARPGMTLEEAITAALKQNSK